MTNTQTRSREAISRLPEELSRKVKALREESGLSQAEIAAKGGLSVSLVAKLEQGKKSDPRVSSLLAIAEALGVKPGELLDDLFPAEEDAAAEEVLAEMANPSGGIIGIVDRLLAIAAERPFRIEAADGGYRVTMSGREAMASSHRPIFRAILARVAVLCDEQAPGTFSPYGGRGTIERGNGPALSAVFVNTTDKQSLELSPSAARP
jgi:transcriptional regulator with XRE-family HTH domain